MSGNEPKFMKIIKSESVYYMKFSPLVAAMALVASPLSAQSNDIDDVDWGEPEKLEAMVLECAAPVTLEDCAAQAKRDALKFKVPTYVVHHEASGRTTFHRVAKDTLETAFAEDILPLIDMHSNTKWDAPVRKQAHAFKP